MVAGLVQRGFEYVTDEAVAIDPATSEVHPYPKALAIEPGAFDLLADLRPAPEARFAPYEATQWNVAPGSIGTGVVVSGPCRPRLVISPRYERGTATTLEPLSRARGLTVLAENAFNFGAHRKTALNDLAAVVRTCECYRLTYGALAEACTAVSMLVDRLGVAV